MNITRVEWAEQDKYPILSMTIDGVRVNLTTPKKTLLDRGILVLGGNFLSNPPSAIWKGDRDIPAQVFTDATDDPAAVGYARDFWNACNDGTFTPRRIL